MNKRKVLVIPGYRIYPIDSGGAHGQLVFLDKQQHQFDLHLILTPNNIQFGDIPAFRKRFPLIKVVALGFDIKKQKGIGAFFRKQKRKFSGKDFSYLMRKVNHINGLFISNPALIEEISNYVNNGQFDLIQVEHLVNAGLISILPKNVKKVFVQHEVGFLRVHDDLRSLGYSPSYASYLSGFAEGAEVYWIKQYDGVITFNNDDVALLRSKGVTQPMQAASAFALFDDELKNIYDAAKDPALIFIGGEEHYPNKEGLQWFLDDVFPLIIEKNKNARLIITSKWSEEFKNKYKNERITFTGYLEDLNTVLVNGILISPIRIGSGIRVKVFTSMAKGLPIVSTTLGASGIPDLVHGENIFLADNKEDFASAAAALLDDEELRKKVSNGAYNLSNKNFSALQFVQNRNTFYEEIMNTVPLQEKG